MSPCPEALMRFRPVSQFHRAAQAQKDAKHNKIMLTMSHVPFVIGILLISAKHRVATQYILYTKHKFNGRV